METIFDTLIRQIESIKVDNVIEEVFKEDRILKKAAMLQRLQYLAGEAPDGGYYSGYSKYTEQDNPNRVTKVTAGDPLKFKNKGNFHKQLKAFADKDTIVIKSTAVVAAKLEEIYRDMLYGLNEASLEMLMYDVREISINKIKDKFKI
jgi:hypothetical protein